MAYGCQTPSAQCRSDQNSGHLRLCQQPRAAHALRSDQKTVATLVCSAGACNTLGPIVWWPLCLLGIVFETPPRQHTHFALTEIVNKLHHEYLLNCLNSLQNEKMYDATIILFTIISWKLFNKVCSEFLPHGATGVMFPELRAGKWGTIMLRTINFPHT